MRRIWEKPVAPRCYATEKIISIIDLHFLTSIAARLSARAPERPPR